MDVEIDSSAARSAFVYISSNSLASSAVHPPNPCNTGPMTTIGTLSDFAQVLCESWQPMSALEDYQTQDEQNTILQATYAS